MAKINKSELRALINEEVLNYISEHPEVLTEGFFGNVAGGLKNVASKVADKVGTAAKTSGANIASKAKSAANTLGKKVNDITVDMKNVYNAGATKAQLQSSIKTLNTVNIQLQKLFDTIINNKTIDDSIKGTLNASLASNKGAIVKTIEKFNKMIKQL